MRSIWGGDCDVYGSRYKEGYNSIVKQRNKIKDINFVCESYQNVDIPLGSMVYCDIPYKSDIKRYIGNFNHDDFYSWVRLNCHNYDIYISEYIENVPSDFNIVWQKESKQDVKNPNVLTKKVKTECLIKYNG
jgi:hypothetical protein